MCITNGRTPTKEDRKTITEGYKVFKVVEHRKYGIPKSKMRKYLHSIYYYFCYKKRVWNEAELRHCDSGFYVFIRKEDAEILRKAKEGLTHLELVVRKVKIKGLIEIGKPWGMLDTHLMKGLCVRCKKLRILPEEPNTDKDDIGGREWI